MNRNTKITLIVLAIAVLSGLIYQGLFDARVPLDTNGRALASGLNQHGEEEEHESDAIIMSAAERQENGVVSTTVEYLTLTETITVPGEVRLDLYRTSRTTPRISAQVVARHARLGENVTEGQPLVTLSSVEMAEAQGNLIVANQEWRRVSQLGRDVVSERRFIEAQVEVQQAKARVEAYGMTPEQILPLLNSASAANANGAFDLLSPQAGTVVEDSFVVGDFVDPGQTLFAVSDENYVWVEAQLAAEKAVHIEISAPALIYVAGRHTMEGRVVQAYHSLDETTRTLPVRLEVKNIDDELHPGQFVETSIVLGETPPLIAVPAEAVVLMRGSPSVFVLRDDEIVPRSVQLGESHEGWVEIKEGISVGDEVVVRNVFLLKSLSLKSEIGDEH